jgi:tRNA(Ile)-lysidine synthase
MVAAKRRVTDPAERLCGCLARPPAGPYCVGLSGGLDSVALLHLARRCLPSGSVSALHVHHGLSPNADTWAQFCVDLCARLGVPLQVARVVVTTAGGGLEEAARQARYAAYAGQPAPVVLLAQHADDQAETLLFNLLRGAGVQGAAAMPVQRVLAPGYTLWRPLLAVGRGELFAWARAQGLTWIEDESNEDTAFSRNFLRREIVPVLSARFPAATGKLAQAAGLLGEAAGLLDQLAAADTAADAAALAAFQQLTPARQRNLLRYWLRGAGAAMPAQVRLDEARRQLATAMPEEAFAVAVGTAEFGLWRGRIDCHPAWVGTLASCRWQGETQLPWADGTLAMTPQRGQGIARARLSANTVEVRARRGGEHLRLVAQRPRRTLAKLFQECGVAPWLRTRLPLLYAGDELVWVAGVGVAAAWLCGADEEGVLPSWSL